MSRSLTTTQQGNLTANATRPIFLVKWAWNGTTEYLSCSGAVTFDSSPYTAGGINIRQIEDSKTATLFLPATSTRVTELLSNDWRGASCVIYAIAASPSDSPTYSASDGITVLDGIIESAQYAGDTLTVTAKCKYYIGAQVPRFIVNEISTQVPGVGASYNWDDDQYDYRQWVQSNTRIQRLVRPGTNAQFIGRPSTSDVNEFSQIENTGFEPITGAGAYIPLVYGRASVPGKVFIDLDYDDGGSAVKVIGVVWCMGPIASIENVYINNAQIASNGVRVRHYLGNVNQITDFGLRDVLSTSPQFDEDLIFDLPAGSIGVAYSVFIIDASTLSTAPAFRAVIKGRIVEDTDSLGNGNPFYDDTAFAFDFLNSGTTDLSPNARTITLNGDASISSPSIGLELDGTGDSGTITTPSPNIDDVGASQFTLELKFVPRNVGSPADTETLIQHGSTTSSPQSRSLRIDRYGNSIKLYISTNGTSYDVVNGETVSGGNVTILSGNTFDIDSPQSAVSVSLVKYERQWTLYVNGEIAITALTPVTSPETYNGLYATTADWQVGTGDGGDFTGEIHSLRLTTGFARYGGYHNSTATPFSDSNLYGTYDTYSNKPALAWSDLAQDPHIGLNATVTNVSEAVAYGDELMDCGEPRCRIGLVIEEVRRVERWLDQLAYYANCLWFPEGSDLKIVPDRIAGANSSGTTEIVEDGTFSGSPVTAWDAGSPVGWAIGGGVATGDGGFTQTLSQTVTVESNVRYKLSFEVTTTSPLASGSLSVEADGVALTGLNNATSAGTYFGYFTAGSTSVLIEFLGVTWTGSITNVTIKRAFYEVSRIVGQ